MMEKRHIMVDLETLGSNPGCAILSIGAIEFFPLEDRLGDRVYYNVDLGSCLQAGLQVESETVYWWLAQSQEARVSLINDRIPLASALEQFRQLFNPHTLVWGHGPSFDLSVLACAYQALGWVKPWAYRNERDTRTILDLAGMTMGKSSTVHHALEDAKVQALSVMSALRVVML